jgi:hypothetical protein
MTLISGPGANFFGFRDPLPAPLSHYQLACVFSWMPEAQCLRALMINRHFQKDFAMKQLTLIAAAAVFFTTGLAYGQAKPGPNYEHLKPLEFMIGEWVLEDTMDEDVPNIGEAGDHFLLTIKWGWGLRKNIINEQLIVRVNDKMTWSTRAMIGWDAEKKQIVSTSFDSLGGHGGAVIACTEDGFTMKNRTVSAEGTPSTSTVIIKRVDEDTIGGETKDITEDGEKKPDRPYVELKRKK